jgi:hypothetical protein
MLRELVGPWGQFCHLGPKQTWLLEKLGVCVADNFHKIKINIFLAVVQHRLVVRYQLPLQVESKGVPFIHSLR